MKKNAKGTVSYADFHKKEMYLLVENEKIKRGEEVYSEKTNGNQFRTVNINS